MLRLELRSFALIALIGLSATLGCPSDPGTADTFGSFTTTMTAGDGDSTSTSDSGDGDGDPNTNCGDEIVQAGEECDLGPANDDAAVCTSNCTIAVCGDGLIYAGFEECDDANTSSTDDCVQDCKVATCGDGFVHDGVEACDDANMDETDGCTSICTPATCGDGVVQEGEQCDDDNLDTSDECPACQLAFCGDGYTQAGIEECDDGNNLDNDSCVSPFCSTAFCGDGYLIEGVEECDDANDLDNDMCPTSCTVATCGDGFVLADVEECDDANNDDDDDCANDCTWNQCQPLGPRAPFNTLGLNTASGCWDGNPCPYNDFSWDQSHGQNFQAFDEALSCTGAPTCVANVGITTYSSGGVCQGKWDVYCDDIIMGTIDTVNVACTGSAMNNNCSISFPGRICTEIELRAVADNDNVMAGCCGAGSPDSMMTGVSAW
jgi:cysteine-rich repeat protein